MKTSVQLHETCNKRRSISESERNYYKDCFLKSVENLFSSYDIGFIFSYLGELLYYTENPDDAKELTKKDLVTLISKQSDLIAYFSESYVKFKDYQSTKEGGEL
jgi:hypothetical protein